MNMSLYQLLSHRFSLAYGQSRPSKSSVIPPNTGGRPAVPPIKQTFSTHPGEKLWSPIQSSRLVLKDPREVLWFIGKDSHFQKILDMLG